ncbi:hypothetical protein [Streptomyces sp. SudanB91_2054]|uniref:hypothetical protein n=1 Tax=Streptomyces sp. SudanB91_2054 TaxID=3035278 RepID=UPI0036D8DB94
MISPLAMTAKKVIEAAWLNGPTYDMAVQAAEALESAQLLQSPETAAELARLRADQAANDREYEAATARIAELEAQRDRRRDRLVVLQNDALNMRGSLSPNGQACKVPFPLGETLAPAVDWLIARIAELEAKLSEAEQASEANFWSYVGQKDRADAAREDAVAALIEAAELSPEHAEALYERARSIAKAPTWPDHNQLGKSSRTPADATPVDTNRRARLLAEISKGGRWKSGDVVRWYKANDLRLGIHVARRDLKALRESGALAQHDQKGVRFYTLARQRRAATAPSKQDGEGQ